MSETKPEVHADDLQNAKGGLKPTKTVEKNPIPVELKADQFAAAKDHLKHTEPEVRNLLPTPDQIEAEKNAQ